MKGKALLFLLSALMLVLQACNTCSEADDFTVLDSESQYFTLTYVDPSGVNYVNSIYDEPNVIISVNDNGGFGSYELISRSAVPVGSGQIGPFEFTTFPEQARVGFAYDYWFIIQKDTYGSDTIRVQFLPTIDECHQYFQELNYYRNGILLPEYSNMQVANLQFVE